MKAHFQQAIYPIALGIVVASFFVVAKLKAKYYKKDITDSPLERPNTKYYQ